MTFGTLFIIDTSSKSSLQIDQCSILDKEFTVVM
jgi:hypothetical protein